jgi:phosphoribosyl-AMP cyclohydrolase / phosphoribosyl-ATP pyrophosphohydrolase
MNIRLEDIKFDERGLAPAIVQDSKTREVLTLAYVNKESLKRTLEEKETWFWSRSRKTLWHKGETSGNVQRVVDIRLDCDSDSLLLLVEPTGPACHTGEISCFHNNIEGIEETANSEPSNLTNIGEMLEKLYTVIEERRRERPEGSYTTYLFNNGIDKILKKVGEEAAETIIAAKNEEKQPFISETSDLIYHLLVLLVERNVSLEEISKELSERVGKRRTK